MARSVPSGEVFREFNFPGYGRGGVESQKNGRPVICTPVSLSRVR
jgi:hypothetical protein